MAEFFSRRATVRRYTGETPSRELIDSILEAAMRAPTTGNMQLYSVVETRDAEMRRRLAELHFNQPAASGAPLMLTFCADYYRFTRWCEVSDADAGYDNFLSFTSAMMDTAVRHVGRTLRTRHMLSRHVPVQRSGNRRVT